MNVYDFEPAAPRAWLSSSGDDVSLISGTKRAKLEALPVRSRTRSSPSPMQTARAVVSPAHPKTTARRPSCRALLGAATRPLSRRTCAATGTPMCVTSGSSHSICHCPLRPLRSLVLLASSSLLSRTALLRFVAVDRRSCLRRFRKRASVLVRCRCCCYHLRFDDVGNDVSHNVTQHRNRNRVPAEAIR